MASSSLQKLIVQGLVIISLAGLPVFAQTDAPDEQLWAEAAAGDARAQRELGDWHVLKGDRVQGVRWYRKAAEQGDAEAQFSLGLSYNSGIGAPQNYTEAVRWWRKAAKQGLAKAQFNLGASYAHGEGVPQDYAEAYVWFSLAASGSAKAYSDPSMILREQIAKELAPAQLAAAQVRLQQCMDTNFMICGSDEDQ
jgi:TPR repeat protein